MIPPIASITGSAYVFAVSRHNQLAADWMPLQQALSRLCRRPGNPALGRIQSATTDPPHDTARLQIYDFRLSGTLPPFSSSLCITARCRAMFSSALPSAPACTFSSLANSLRAVRLESRSSSFSRSTIDVRQLLSPPFWVAEINQDYLNIHLTHRRYRRRRRTGGCCRSSTHCIWRGLLGTSRVGRGGRDLRMG